MRSPKRFVFAVLASAVLTATIAALAYGTRGAGELTASTSRVVWSAGMETGDLSEWEVGGTGDASWDSRRCFRPPNGVSTAAARSGRYSMAMTIDTSQGDAGCRQARYRESRTGRPFYYGAWFYLPMRTVADDYWNIFQLKSKRRGAEGSDPFWVVDLMPRRNGALALRLRWKGLVPGPFAQDGSARRTWSQSAVNVPVGRWFHIEAYVRQSGGYGGRVAVWQDGVRLWNLDGVRTRYEDGDQRWTVNNYSDDLTPARATLYVDDATVATRRAGTTFRP